MRRLSTAVSCGFLSAIPQAACASPPTSCCCEAVREFSQTPTLHFAAGLGAPTRTLLMRKFKGRKGPRTRESKEGDWLCQCGETNYRSKRECYKCGAPAPPLPPGVRRPSLPGEDPNDWACPCGQMNFRGSVNCHKCLQPKPIAPPPPGQEITMWTCVKCKNINRNTRKNCFKCFAMAPAGVMQPIKPNQQQGNQLGTGGQQQQQQQSPLGGMFASMGSGQPPTGGM
eukprot:GILI01033494.1.p1 GENE.GILI01033494.1~~GILI01033494.1.p1  ORF type:complete len:238 (+),score=13.09 GILI01033494.1:35-715(+)